MGVPALTQGTGPHPLHATQECLCLRGLLRQWGETHRCSVPLCFPRAPLRTPPPSCPHSPWEHVALGHSLHGRPLLRASDPLWYNEGTWTRWPLSSRPRFGSLGWGQAGGDSGRCGSHAPARCTLRISPSLTRAPGLGRNSPRDSAHRATSGFPWNTGAVHGIRHPRRSLVPTQEPQQPPPQTLKGPAAPRTARSAPPSPLLRALSPSLFLAQLPQQPPGARSPHPIWRALETSRFPFPLDEQEAQS